ncbi:hypothetical protein N0V83_000978 [Neocucurbitaria cava]|uniref:Uncharacterized protein n=1 Tax=Neocucurbitaria cava TaxID=798079 RepID=A0A9W8YHE5_9PLEO|nr:hypothetical protein N0V83_000978 [Neocucurbitaria cava]
MTDSNPNPSSRRGPAVFVGGQRRRLVRRSNLPRPEASTASHASHVTAAATSSETVDREEAPTSTVTQGPSTMNFYPPTGGIPTDLRPSSKSRPSNSSSTSLLAADSPTPTTVSEGKKKQSFFDGIKSKDRDRPGSSHASSLPTSPLPPSTPSKAAQFLGIDQEPPTFGSPRERHGQYDGVQHGVPVRPALHKQSSMPLLTKFKEATTGRQTKFKEEDVESDSPRSKKFWASGNKKAMKMLDLLPSLGSSSKRANSDEHVAPSPSLARTNIGYSSETDLHAPQPMPPRAPGSIPARRMRKKGPKSLDRMAPITESSHDELGAVYRNSEHVAELDVISEYEDHNLSYNAAVASRYQTESMLTPTIRYELEDDELSSTDDIIEDEALTWDEQAMLHGTPINMSRKKLQQAAGVLNRGPLQTIEGRLLDEAEKDIEARKATLDRLDAEKLKVDKEVASLKESHEKMQEDFQAIKQRAVVHKGCDCAHEHHDHETEESEDDEDLVSLRSSIDLDEEPTVHIATPMTFTRITPGMVKLVDIPPRKNKAKAPVAAAISPEAKQTEPKSPYFFKHGDDISPSNERRENVSAHPEVLEASKYSRLTKAKKVKMPREESRLLVEDWIANSPGPAAQRPVSERIDLDVLADQQIPPAPSPRRETRG